MGSLQPLGAEDSSFSHSRSHSQSSHFPPPLARTAGGGNSNSSNHRVRKFVIGGMSQPCPATPVPAVTPLGGGAAIPSFSSSSLSSSTHEADKENDRRSSCTSTAAVPSSSSSSSSGEALPSSAAPADLDVVGQKRKRSERVSVRLVPLDAATAERVRRAGYNPKLELWTPVRYWSIPSHAVHHTSHARGFYQPT